MQCFLSVRFEVGVSFLLAPAGADKRGPKAPFPPVENAGIHTAGDSQESTRRSSGGSRVLLKALYMYLYMYLYTCTILYPASKCSDLPCFVSIRSLLDILGRLMRFLMPFHTAREHLSFECCMIMLVKRFEPNCD